MLWQNRRAAPWGLVERGRQQSSDTAMRAPKREDDQRPHVDPFLLCPLCIARRHNGNGANQRYPASAHTPCSLHVLSTAA